jgi:hypothetical protein
VFAGGAAAGCSKTPEAATPNVNVPDVNVNVDDITNDATKCAELGASYATLFTSVAIDGDTAKVNAEIDKLKGQVPDSVKDDLTALGEGFADAEGQMGVAEFMASPEFTTANETVTKYLTIECSQVGS